MDLSNASFSIQLSPHKGGMDMLLDENFAGSDEMDDSSFSLPSMRSPANPSGTPSRYGRSPKKMNSQQCTPKKRIPDLDFASLMTPPKNSPPAVPGSTAVSRTPLRHLTTSNVIAQTLTPGRFEALKNGVDDLLREDEDETADSQQPSSMDLVTDFSNACTESPISQQPILSPFPAIPADNSHHQIEAESVDSNESISLRDDSNPDLLNSNETSREEPAKVSSLEPAEIPLAGPNVDSLDRIVSVSPLPIPKSSPTVHLTGQTEELSSPAAPESPSSAPVNDNELRMSELSPVRVSESTTRPSQLKRPISQLEDTDRIEKVAHKTKKSSKPDPVGNSRTMKTQSRSTRPFPTKAATTARSTSSKRFESKGMSGSQSRKLAERKRATSKSQLRQGSNKLDSVKPGSGSSLQAGPCQMDSVSTLPPTKKIVEVSKPVPWKSRSQKETSLKIEEPESLSGQAGEADNKDMQRIDSDIVYSKMSEYSPESDHAVAELDVGSSNVQQTKPRDEIDSVHTEKPAFASSAPAPSTSKFTFQSSVHAVPDFKALHASLASKKRPVKITKARSPPKNLASRLAKREDFDRRIKDAEKKREVEREEARKRQEEEEGKELREERRRRVVKAHEVPAWYKDAPKAKRKREN